MKQIVQVGYGAADQMLKLQDAAQPALDDDRVLVRVRASSVNSGDWRQVRAHPLIIRFTLGLRRPKNGAIGGDFAGVVEKTGSSVTDLRAGDEVFGVRTGAFADYVAARFAVAKPTNLTFEQAATIPVAATTALQALRDKGRVQPGEKVLINGAGGGVGHFAVQIAKAFGAEVTGVTSTDKLEFVKSIGADRVIDYLREDFTKGAERYDLIVDCGGDRSFGRTRQALAAQGRLVIVGAYRRVLTRLVVGSLRSRLLGQRITFFLAHISREDLLTLKDLAESSKLRPHIDRTYPLEQVAQAIDYAEKQRVAGKIAVTVPA